MSRDLFEAMANRRSIKRFQPRPVEMDKVLQIVQAGCLAPSSGNIRNWNYVIVTDVDKIRRMYSISLDQEPFLSAMAAIVVTGDAEYAHQLYGMRGKRLYTVQNCAAAIQNMLLTAHALDLGATWIGAFDEDKLSEMFEIPNDRHRPQAIILLGYPDANPEQKDDKPWGNCVYFNSFGNKVQKPHLVFYDWATEWRLLGQKAKGHAQQVVKNVKRSHEKHKEERAKKKEQSGKTSFHRARSHIDSVLNSLKKEEFRK